MKREEVFSSLRSGLSSGSWDSETLFPDPQMFNYSCKLKQNVNRSNWEHPTSETHIL